MLKQFYVKQFSLVLIQFQCQKTVLFQIIQFSISTQFKYKYGLIVKTFFYTIQFSQTIQFSISMPLDRALSGATKPAQSGLGSNGSQCILLPQPTGQYTELNVKTVLFQIIQFSTSTQFKYQNSSILKNSI